jgi:hypothetical protein
MTESVEYRFSFLLHRAFTATTVFQNNFCVYYVVSDINRIMSLSFLSFLGYARGMHYFDTIPLFVLIHQVKFLRHRKKVRWRMYDTHFSKCQGYNQTVSLLIFFTFLNHLRDMRYPWHSNCKCSCYSC